MTKNERGEFSTLDLAHESSLRDFAMAYPETTEDHPWGECAFKVRKKVFLFVSLTSKGLSLTVKLPRSGEEALLLPFTEATGYGLGKHGWVSAKFGLGQRPPLSIIAGWIEESYRCVAPKGLVAQLNEHASAKPSSPRKKA